MARPLLVLFAALAVLLAIPGSVSALSLNFDDLPIGPFETLTLDGVTFIGDGGWLVSSIPFVTLDGHVLLDNGGTASRLEMIFDTPQESVNFRFALLGGEYITVEGFFGGQAALLQNFPAGRPHRNALYPEGGVAISTRVDRLVINAPTLMAVDHLVTTGGEGAGFHPNDGRLNPQAFAPVAIYCRTEGVSIYGINSAGRGYEAIFIPFAEIPAPAESPLLLESFENIRFYLLPSGEYNVTAGPDAEGKIYTAVWNGCPSAAVRTQITQHGVVVASEMVGR